MASQEVKHDYHLVEPSAWPLIGSIGAFLMAFGAIVYFQTLKGTGLHIFGVTLSGPWMLIIGTLIVTWTMWGWWSDVIDESVRRGDHTPVVKLHLRYGMILFIASEVMFFVGWFWAYFNTALFPTDIAQATRTELIGGVWPPKDTYTFDPWHLPLLNTLILLTSGTTVTWAHHAVQTGNKSGVVWGLGLTIILGLTFTAVQVYEYTLAPFTFSQSIYGATFFMATGFHGFHVVIGTIFLIICFFRAMAGHFTPERHFGFEAAAWYWHFVDVVWLFLFATIYVWGAGTPMAH